ncbi:MAG: tetratricopeptide repeat protein [Methylobacterium mesophilicum]|nr:tetratricopeptide repeat protein [Methylobacterium mesophilicum]
MKLGRSWKVAWAAGTVLMAATLPLHAQEQDAAADAKATIRASSFAGAFLAGRVAEVDNDYGNAVAYYQRALLLSPDNSELQQNLMLTLIAAGRFDEALPLAEKLKTRPEIERFSRLALAVDAINKKKFFDAENFLKLALESDLDRVVTKVMTAWAQEGAGKGKEALATIDAVKGPDWFRVFTKYHRALIADASNQKGEAQKAYAELMEDADAAATAPDTFLRAAESYVGFLSRQNRKKDALDVIARSEEAAPGRVSTAVLRKKVEAGEKIPPLAGNAQEGAAEILLNMASALNRSGGEPFVRLYLNYTLALHPGLDEALIQLASVDEQQKNAEGAIKLYERVPDDSPLKRAAELQRGLNLADLKRYDEAIKQLSILREADPDDMRAYLALGGVYAAREDYRSAANVYDQAVERLKKPGASDWNIFYQRGIAYERLKEWPKAEPNFFKALELNPDQPQVLNYLGYSWVDMNMNLDRGLDMIRKAVELRPSDGYIVDSLGWAYYRLGRYPEAVTELERSVSLKPDDPVLNDHLGDGYWRVGRKLEATFQWSHARDLKPEPDLLASVLKKLKEGLPDEPKKATSQATPQPAQPSPQPEPDKRTEATPVAPEATEASAEPAAAPAVVPASYTVKAGQSLWSIANEALGDGNRYREILDLNPALRNNPARIRAGQELVLPAGQ